MSSKNGNPQDDGAAGDRRSFTREAVACPVRVHIDPTDPDAPVLEGAVENLSVHGARVVTSKYWASWREEIVLEFLQADEGIRPARATATVHWVMQDEPDVSILGIEFEPPLAHVAHPADPPANSDPT